MVAHPSSQRDASSTFLVETSGKAAAPRPSGGTSRELRFLAPSEVVIGPELGAGSFSTVHKARIAPPENAPVSSSSPSLSSSSSKEYALKRLSDKSLGADPAHRQNALKDLRNEATLLSTLPRHRNVIRLHALSSDFWRDDNGEDVVDSSTSSSSSSSTSTSPLAGGFLVLELMVETLHDRLQRARKQEMFRAAQRGAVTTALKSRLQHLVLLPSHHEARRRATQLQLSRLYSVGLPVCRGVAFLHQHRVAIRDLKPSNIGFDHKGRVKLLDFGLARIVRRDDNDLDGGLDDDHDHDHEGRHFISPGTGTLRYMAPEVMTSTESSGRGCDLLASDVYSLSVVLWEAITTQLPFADIRDPSVAENRVTHKGTRPSLRIVEAKALRGLLQAGWDASPGLRPSAASMRHELEAFVASAAPPPPTGT